MMEVMSMKARNQPSRPRRARSLSLRNLDPKGRKKAKPQTKPNPRPGKAEAPLPMRNKPPGKPGKPQP